jgi:hypothetical protein
VALALLLLFQPLLCVIHCVMHTQAAEAHPGTAGLFLCHTSSPADDVSLLIPAFWPGVLPALLILALAATTLRMSLSAPTCSAAHPWAPPLPPPRTCMA